MDKTRKKRPENYAEKSKISGVLGTLSSQNQ